MADDARPSRRIFLKTVGMAGAALPAGATGGAAPAQGGSPEAGSSPAAVPSPRARVTWPRTFTGGHLTQIAFPLGGVAAGTISLGGRGQLRDWEIFNRPDKGNAPEYAFASLWVAREGKPPVSRVLESRLQPPFGGSSGLGSANVPGLSRFEHAEFTGEYPFARIAFADRRVPVRASLEAFSPFIPHEPDDAGLPVAVLRYRLHNPSRVPVTAAIAWSVQNPFVSLDPPVEKAPDMRRAEARDAGSLHGLLLSNPGLPATAPLAGTFVLGVLDGGGGEVTRRRWERAGWWTSVLHFWDDFINDGSLDPESSSSGPVASVCLRRTIPPGGSADYAFLLAWHVPNRTPARCGWTAPPGDEQVVIGNHYCTRFDDAWAAAVHAAERLEELEAKTRTFVRAVRESTLPGAVKDAAMSNLSTLATQTCFRTADGEFHAFEGSNDTSGCCTGNCTHVWNYETSTAHLFPSFSQSLRRSAFGYSLDEDGAMHFRQLLPDGKARSGFAAADGQMGQIVKVYMDWRLSGDDALLAELFPKAWRALAFAWVEGGWDADRDGVLEGAQHNTYDVEFYGPNPQCGIYYLAALRAVEEMAGQLGEREKARQARDLYERGRMWIDEHLWNGEYYVQQVKGMPRAAIHRSLLSSMGSADSEQPQYQVGDGCLADQLIGQYLAEVAGLGALVDAGARAHRARVDLQVQLQAPPRRVRGPAADVRAQRRGRAHRLRLRQGRAALGAVSVLRGSVDRDGILERGDDDLRGSRPRGSRVHRERPAAVRRRAPQSLERAGVRASLRARDVGLVGGAGALAASAITAAPATWRSSRGFRPLASAASGRPPPAGAISSWAPWAPSPCACCTARSRAARLRCDHAAQSRLPSASPARASRSAPTRTITGSRCASTTTCG